MAEILDLEGTLATLRDFGPLRRMILATPGTLQATLTAYFGSQVDVQVRFQDDGRDEKNFTRQVDLVCRERATVVCRARTDVLVEDEGIRRLLRERTIGLGQIIELLRVPTRFELEEVGVDDACFWRVYELRGSGFACRVREEFPVVLYPEP